MKDTCSVVLAKMVCEKIIVTISSHCKIKYRDIFARNVPDVEHCNVPAKNTCAVFLPYLSCFSISNSRVLNVFRQWIDKHFYDFERDKELLTKLLGFLDTVKGKAMKKGVDSIMRHIKKKEESANEEIKLMHIKSPPPIEWHLTKEPKEFDLMMVGF
jgi:hypothetical protein